MLRVICSLLWAGCCGAIGARRTLMCALVAGDFILTLEAGPGMAIISCVQRMRKKKKSKKTQHPENSLAYKKLLGASLLVICLCAFLCRCLYLLLSLLLYSHCLHTKNEWWRDRSYRPGMNRTKCWLLCRKIRWSSSVE